MDDNSRQKVHLVGVCGSGMKALAELLLDKGWSISGSDQQHPSPGIKKLIDRGLVFQQGHRAENLPVAVQHLVFSSAVPSQNPERLAARRRGVPELNYSQMVGALMRDSTGVCVGGTHGKSTTTAMTACILDEAGRLSSAVIGAELCHNGRSGWANQGDLFVAESCEFQQSFFDFNPRYAAILNIEPDHFDCYQDLHSLQLAFRTFIDTIPDDGVIVFNSDDPAAVWVSEASTSRAKRVSFGIHSLAAWSISDRRFTVDGERFRICHNGKSVIDVELKLWGIHNVTNALAATALCAEIGAPLESIRDSLAKFQGIRRRLQFVGEWQGRTIVDDYAHHPTAVKVTLGTLRRLFPDRRIVCVFQPHQISRTTALMNEFRQSFSDANKVLLAPVFAARESVTDEPQIVSRELTDGINSQGVAAQSFASLDQIMSTLEDATRPDDVIVTMGAGDIDRIQYELTRRV